MRESLTRATSPQKRALQDEDDANTNAPVAKKPKRVYPSIERLKREQARRDPTGERARLHAEYIVERDLRQARLARLVAPLDPTRRYWQVLYTTDDMTTYVFLFDPESLPLTERVAMFDALGDDEHTGELFDLVSDGPGEDSVLRGRWVIALPEGEVFTTLRVLKFVQPGK